MNKRERVSTEPYKGVRDFYPEDMAIQNYIFGVWRKTAESFGYVEYGASILEPTELYKAKSGDELVNEQTYSFRDRGERDVTLRPEMTPTVARMIAAKRKELRFPLRWYSIPNLFRYEKPQRGRLREFFQFNADIFGVESIEADIEIITLSYQIMKNFGLTEKQFRIGLAFGANASRNDVDTLIEKLKKIGIHNAAFDESIARGMQYYTGTVFEIYDTNPENPRALFGGGRYDNLLDIFGVEKIPAVGIGSGDAGIRNVLETYNLLPKVESASKIGIVPLDEESIEYAQNLQGMLINAGTNTTFLLPLRKIGDQIKYADKNNIPFVVIIGEEERKTGKFKVKELLTGKETEVTKDTINTILK